jgi:ubiquinone/menaquinone biosynthesis C-methylase UbiE
MISARSKGMMTHYTGAVAESYDARRTGQVKWQREQEILGAIIKGLPEGSSVLDIPCGTGRLFTFFALRRLKVAAMDISGDMLKKAREKGPVDGITLGPGDIFNIPLPDGAVDTAFAIRIMNRIGAADVPLALKELQRVTNKRVIFNLRLPGNPKHRHPVEMSVVEGALEPGWRIAENVEIHEPTFRMITLERE